MIIRLLTLTGILLCTLGQARSQDMDVTPAHYAEAELARLTELLQLRPDQIAECRRVLLDQEDRSSDLRQSVRAGLQQLEETRSGTITSLSRALTEEQTEKLLQAMKKGELPLTWDTAEPGSVRGVPKQESSSGTAPAKKSGAEGKPGTSPTTLSR